MTLRYVGLLYEMKCNVEKDPFSGRGEASRGQDEYDLDIETVLLLLLGWLHDSYSRGAHNVGLCRRIERSSLCCACVEAVGSVGVE